MTASFYWAGAGANCQGFGVPLVSSGAGRVSLISSGYTLLPRSTAADPDRWDSSALNDGLIGRCTGVSERDHKPMPRPPLARAPLKSAALTLFVDQGIHATGIRDIARKAEVSEAALYRHWTNKEDLVQSLYMEHLQDVNDLLTEALKGEGTTEERIRRATRTAFQLFDDKPYVFRFVMLIQHEITAFLEPDVITPHTIVFEFVRELHESGNLDTNPVIVAASMVGLFIETANRVVYGVLPHPMEQYTDDVATLAMRLLKP